MREDRQGTGVGRMLLERAMAACRDEGRSVLVVATAAADVGVLRFYQLLGFRLLRVERDAFTPEAGYPDIEIDGIALRDRVWLSLSRGDAAMPAGLMTRATDDELYVRGSETLLASWEQYARGLRRSGSSTG